jgi:hypothetical protein
MAVSATRLDAQRAGYEWLSCESRDGREEFCRASIAGDVRITRELGSVRCVEGSNWRWSRDGIRVRDGCRAEFEYRRQDPLSLGGGDTGLERTKCESKDGRERYCRAPIEGNVRIAKQLGDTPCVEGTNWRWDPGGISVRDGCRGEFEYRRREGSVTDWDASDSAWGGPRGVVTCHSQKDQEQFCPAAIDGDVKVRRNTGEAPCRKDVNYSWTRDGVRVWNGCGAEFEFRKRG